MMHLVQKRKLKVDVFAAVRQVDVYIFVFEEATFDKVGYGFAHDDRSTRPTVAIDNQQPLLIHQLLDEFVCVHSPPEQPLLVPKVLLQLNWCHVVDLAIHVCNAGLKQHPIWICI